MKIIIKNSKILKSFFFLIPLLSLTVFLGAQTNDQLITPGQNQTPNDINKEKIVAKGKMDYQRVSPKLTRVNYSFSKVARINPYSVNYDFLMREDFDAYYIEMKSFLEDLDMRIDLENTNFSYQGAEVKYPLLIKSGALLQDAEGIFTLEIPSASLVIKYESKLTNRKVLRTEKIKVEGKEYLAYVISSNFEMIKNSDGTKISHTTQTLTDWYIPSLGNVKRERVGQSVRRGEVSTFEMVNSVNSFEE